MTSAQTNQGLIKTSFWREGDQSAEIEITADKLRNEIVQALTWLLSVAQADRGESTEQIFPYGNLICGISEIDYVGGCIQYIRNLQALLMKYTKENGDDAFTFRIIPPKGQEGGYIEKVYVKSSLTAFISFLEGVARLFTQIAGEKNAPHIERKNLYQKLKSLDIYFLLNSLGLSGIDWLYFLAIPDQEREDPPNGDVFSAGAIYREKLIREYNKIWDICASGTDQCNFAEIKEFWAKVHIPNWQWNLYHGRYDAELGRLEIFSQLGVWAREDSNKDRLREILKGLDYFRST